MSEEIFDSRVKYLHILNNTFELKMAKVVFTSDSFTVICGEHTVSLFYTKSKCGYSKHGDMEVRGDGLFMKIMHDSELVPVFTRKFHLEPADDLTLNRGRPKSNYSIRPEPRKTPASTTASISARSVEYDSPFKSKRSNIRSPTVSPEPRRTPLFPTNMANTSMASNNSSATVAVPKQKGKTPEKIMVIDQPRIQTLPPTAAAKRKHGLLAKAGFPSFSPPAHLTTEVFNALLFSLTLN